MTVFWYIIVGIGIIATIINFSLAAARRGKPLVALVRALAGVVSLALPVAVVVGKTLQIHDPFQLQWQTVFIATGVFLFATLFLPSTVERNAQVEVGPTMQERAARPANATIRLQDKLTSDEWVN